MSYAAYLQRIRERQIRHSHAVLCARKPKPLGRETLFVAEDGAVGFRLHQRHDGQEQRRRVFEIRALTEKARQRRRDENVARSMRAFMSKV